MANTGDFLNGKGRSFFGLSWRLLESPVWAMLGFAAYALVVAVGSVLLAAYLVANTPRPPSAADKKLPQLKSAMAELKAGLTAETAARQKDNQDHEARANADRARIAKLEAQRLEDQKTIASLQRENRRLTSDFIMSLLATGAKPAPPSFAPAPNTAVRQKLPKQLRDKVEIDVPEEPSLKKPPCLLEFKGLPLLCGDPNADSRQ